MKLVAAVLLALGSSAFAENAWGGEPTKTELRELTTDRPDATETPFTVDAGHVQLEMSVFSFTVDRAHGVRTTELEGAPLNLRYGVARNLEAGIFITPYVETTERVGGVKTRASGFGDVVARTKVNFWGNDGGSSGFGVMADVKLPTADKAVGNDKVEAALTFPFAFEYGAGWEGGAMTALEYRYTDEGRYRPVWFNTLTCARDLIENVGVFFELTSTTGDGGHELTFDCGLTRKVGAFAQLDAGVNVGLSRSAPDLTVFVGLSKKW